jgi:hypothetical protein
MDAERHVIELICNPYFMIYVASHDVASTIDQSLPQLQRA